MGVLESPGKVLEFFVSKRVGTLEISRSHRRSFAVDVGSRSVHCVEFCVDTSESSGCRR